AEIEDRLPVLPGCERVRAREGERQHDGPECDEGPVADEVRAGAPVGPPQRAAEAGRAGTGVDGKVLRVDDGGRVHPVWGAGGPEPRAAPALVPGGGS